MVPMAIPGIPQTLDSNIKRIPGLRIPGEPRSWNEQGAPKTRGVFLGMSQCHRSLENGQKGLW